MDREHPLYNNRDSLEICVPVCLFYVSFEIKYCICPYIVQWDSKLYLISFNDLGFYEDTAANKIMNIMTVRPTL